MSRWYSWFSNDWTAFNCNCIIRNMFFSSPTWSKKNAPEEQEELPSDQLEEAGLLPLDGENFEIHEQWEQKKK